MQVPEKCKISKLLVGKVPYVVHKHNTLSLVSVFDGGELISSPLEVGYVAKYKASSVSSQKKKSPPTPLLPSGGESIEGSRWMGDVFATHHFLTAPKTTFLHSPRSKAYPRRRKIAVYFLFDIVENQVEVLMF